MSERQEGASAQTESFIDDYCRTLMEADMTTTGKAKSRNSSTAVSILIFNIYNELKFPVPVSYIQFLKKINNPLDGMAILM